MLGPLADLVPTAPSAHGGSKGRPADDERHHQRSRRFLWERLFSQVFRGAHTNSRLIIPQLRERSNALLSAPVVIRWRYFTMRAGEDQGRFSMSGINILVRFASLIQEIKVQ